MSQLRSGMPVSACPLKAGKRCGEKKQRMLSPPLSTKLKPVIPTSAKIERVAESTATPQH
jgi:hypothetical protein